MALNSQVLLPAETTATRDQRRPHFLFGGPKQRRHLSTVLPDALALGVDVHAPVRRRHGKAGFWLEKGMFDTLRVEGLSQYVRGCRQRRVYVAALDFRARKKVAAGVDQRRPFGQGRLGACNRLEHLVLDRYERRGRARGGPR